MNIDLPDRLLELFVAQSRKKNLKLDEYLHDIHTQLSNQITSQPQFSVSIDDKLATSELLLEMLLLQLTTLKHVALAWTGGKDSTVLLWLMKRVIDKHSLKWPHIVLIDEGDMFEEVEIFCKDLADMWEFEYKTISNADILSQVNMQGDTVQVDGLNERNRREFERLNYSDSTWNFASESDIGNHLMKTVVQNVFIEMNHIKYLITGIRWDEQAARADETYFSDRGDKHTPKHVRVHPLLHFTEKDIWETIHTYSIPFVSLYSKGFRSLGAKSSTDKSDAKPAWEQDLEHTSERSGRAQDKEKVMERLRKLGYM